MKQKDYSLPEPGRRFGRLIVRESYLKNFGTYKKTVCLCQCDCGKKCEVSLNNLRRNIAKSCGCLQKEKASKANKTHGLTDTVLYRKWSSIKRRCHNPNSVDWPNYGGRGITVCEEWRKSFFVFAEWALANGYQDDLEIDRIDTDKGYSPSNCRFITKLENIRNRRVSKHLEVDGVSKPVMQWCEELGLNYSTVMMRIRRGKTGRDVLKV